MTKLNAFWRAARMGALGLAVAIVIGVAAHPAEARGYWHWNGASYVWIGGPAYGPGYYPAPYYYPPYPAYPYPAYYPSPYYYGPSVGFSFRFH